jgi:hypothetical protein
MPNENRRHAPLIDDGWLVLATRLVDLSGWQPTMRTDVPIHSVG